MLELRKFGFSALTALFAISSFLLPSDELAVILGNEAAFQESIKFAILTVLLILAFALQILDRNPQVLQQAASTRAKVINRALDLELTEIISKRFRVNWVSRLVAGVYLLYSIAVIVLSYFLLTSHGFHFLVTIGVAVITIAFSLFLATVYPVKLYFPCGKID